MYSTVMRDAPLSVEVNKKLGFVCICEMRGISRLCRFGHVERQDENDLVKLVEYFKVEKNCQ